jgi:hypothetical protein
MGQNGPRIAAGARSNAPAVGSPSVEGDAARLEVMALQCRLGVDQYNAAHGVDRSAVAAALNRDEALGEMVKNRTSNVTTLDLASDALTSIHTAQAKLAPKPY